MKYRRALANTLTLVAAAGAAVMVAGLAVGLVEDRSSGDVARRLDLIGLDWADVQADGLQVVLSGEAPDEATRFRAMREAGTVIDAARVVDVMTVKQEKPVEPPKFSVEILRNDKDVKLIGLVPTSSAERGLLAPLRDITDAGNLSDLLDRASYPPPPEWDEALDFGLLALRELPRSKISILAGQVDVRANAESAEERFRILEKLRAAIPTGLKVSIEISAPRPVITPYSLRFLIDQDGARFDACSTDTEDGRTLILKAARAAGLEGEGQCVIGLGVPSPAWDDAAVLAIEAIGSLGAGSVTFSDADISLIGDVGTDPETFDRVTSELKAKLPEVFALVTYLPEPEPEDAQSGPIMPELIVTLGEDGLARLRGPVPDDRTRLAAAGVARAAFGGDAVHDALRLRDDLPQGWGLRVYAAIEALGVLNSGSVRARPDTVSISGLSGNPDASAEIARILAERLPDDARFDIDVTYVEALDPLANIPTPEECVGQINQVLAAQKITFAPSSADIDDDGRAIIDKIAEIMKGCEAVAMEVAGHTDSQGREIMNKELSQARADAVVNALLARRVLTRNLTAVGYGEEHPIADNDTEEGREANRRIEFSLRVDEPEGDADMAGVADGDEATDGNAAAEAAPETDNASSADTNDSDETEQTDEPQ